MVMNHTGFDVTCTSHLSFGIRRSAKITDKTIHIFNNHADNLMRPIFIWVLTQHHIVLSYLFLVFLNGFQPLHLSVLDFGSSVSCNSTIGADGATDPI